jgi:hypothetical protein
LRARLLRGVLVVLLTLSVSAATTRANSRGDADWLMRAFLCIHSHEASWDDPGSPYYGGLQMDTTFMRTYAPEYLRAFGTADHWPPALQIAVAIRAYLSGRGFYPWPNTARACGLL